MADGREHHDGTGQNVVEIAAHRDASPKARHLTHEPVVDHWRTTLEESRDCSYRVMTVAQAVRAACDGELKVPSFQRGFVWKPGQVCDLADSLWRGYPIGPLLLWDPLGEGTPLWITDGQQRLTSLCLLFGQRPNWWSQGAFPDWSRTLARFEILFDIEAEAPPCFKSAVSEGRLEGWLKLRSLLCLDAEKPEDRIELERIGHRRKLQGQLAATSSDELYHRLDRVRVIRDRTLVVTVSNHGLEDVLEIFERLNSRGIKFRRLLLRLLMRSLRAGRPRTITSDTGPVLF